MSFPKTNPAYASLPPLTSNLTQPLVPDPVFLKPCSDNERAQRNRDRETLKERKTKERTGETKKGNKRNKETKKQRNKETKKPQKQTKKQRNKETKKQRKKKQR